MNFGDSIFGNFQAPQDISTYLAGQTGATVYNVGFGGCRMGAHREYWDSFSMYRLADAVAGGDWTRQNRDIAHKCWTKPSYFKNRLKLLQSIDFSRVDIITISYGTNDFASNNLLEDPDELKSTATFAGALRHSIEQLSSAAPAAKIVLCTPIYRYWMDDEGVFLYDAESLIINEQNLVAFAEKTKEVAKEYDLPVIDNYYGPGICKENREKYFNGKDGTHPNNTARILIADHMAKELHRLFENSKRL